MTEPLEIDSPQSKINRARFASKDFFTFVDDIIARVQALFVTEFNDFVASGTGLMLIDIVSWACETLSFFIDRQASESYIFTARLRKSVNRLAKQIGYKMRSAVGAAVDLEVNLEEVQAFDVTIPIGFQFQGPEDLIFEAIEAVTFPTGEGPTSPPRTVGCIEGITVTQVFTSNGTKNQAFRLQPGEDKWVGQGTPEVTVDGSPWTEQTWIPFEQEDYYEVDYNNEPILLRFGDGIAGNIPPNGAEIRATFRATSGEGGLVMTDTIDDVVNTLVVAFTNIGLIITNPDPSSGGSNRETIEETKRNAPLFFYARNVAVTREDYIGLSQAYSDPVAGAVAVAQAFVALGAEDDIQLQILIDNIEGIVAPLSANVQAATAQIASDVDAVQVLRGTAETENGDVATALGNITSAAGTARSEATDAKNDAIQAESQTAAGRAIVVGIGDGGAVADQLSSATYALLLGHYTATDTETGSIKTHCDNVVGQQDTIDGEVTDATAAQAEIATDLTAMSPLLLSIEAQVAIINTEVTNNFENAIEDELQAIYDHVDGFLANECQANLVQVPILTRDRDGFFQAPPVALMRSLETYLRGRKEVTQVVEVVSGEPWLVLATIEGTIGVIDGYVQATVLSNVRNFIDDILRDRPFGKNLWLSDIMQVAPNEQTGVGGVEGVRYANLEITGPTQYLVGNNLVIPQKLVISKGSVTLATEVADY
jgi:hypothetical protein